MASERSTQPVDEATKRKLARERRAKANVRQRAKMGPEPALQEPRIRVFPKPVVIAGADPQILFPVYLPDPVQQQREGPRPHRGIVNRLKATAGVAALLSHKHLMIAHAGKDKRHELATHRVARQASLTPDYLSGLGREELARLRLDDGDFERLVALAFAGPAHGLTKDPAKLAEAHLEALGLLTTALVRAERLVAAVGTACAIKNDADAGDEVLREYHHGKVALSRYDLVRIAALADINPSSLWIQHAQLMGPVLEIARLGGKLVKASRHGGQARLDRRMFPTLRLVLGQASFWPDGADAEAAFLLTCRLVGACVDLNDLLRRLDWHDDFELDLVIGEPRA